MTAQALPTLVIAVAVAGASLLVATGRFVPRTLIDGASVAIMLVAVVMAAL